MSITNHKHGLIRWFDGIRPRTQDMWGLVLTLLREGGRDLALNQARLGGVVARGFSVSETVGFANTHFDLTTGMVVLGDQTYYYKEVPTAPEVFGDSVETRIVGNPASLPEYSEAYEDYLERLSGAVLVAVNDGTLVYDVTKTPSGMIKIPWASVVVDVWNVVTLTFSMDTDNQQAHPLKQATNIDWTTIQSYQIKVYTKAEWMALTEADRVHKHVVLHYAIGNGFTCTTKVEAPWSAAEDAGIDGTRSRVQFLGGSPHITRGGVLEYVNPDSLQVTAMEGKGISGPFRNLKPLVLSGLGIPANRRGPRYVYAQIQDHRANALTVETTVPTAEGLHPNDPKLIFVGSVVTDLFSKVIPFDRHGDQVTYRDAFQTDSWPMRPFDTTPDRNRSPVLNRVISTLAVEAKMIQAGRISKNLSRIEMDFSTYQPLTSKRPIVDIWRRDRIVRRKTFGASVWNVTQWSKAPFSDKYSEFQGSAHGSFRLSPSKVVDDNYTKWVSHPSLHPRIGFHCDISSLFPVGSQIYAIRAKVNLAGPMNDPIELRLVNLNHENNHGEIRGRDEAPLNSGEITLRAFRTVNDGTVVPNTIIPGQSIVAQIRAGDDLDASIEIHSLEVDYTLPYSNIEEDGSMLLASGPMDNPEQGYMPWQGADGTLYTEDLRKEPGLDLMHRGPIRVDSNNKATIRLANQPGILDRAGFTSHLYSVNGYEVTVNIRGYVETLDAVKRY